MARAYRMLPFVLPATLLLAAGPAAGQGTLEDYQRAERFLGSNARALVAGDAVRPVWLDNDRFWYRVSTRTGTEFVLVDPAARRRGPAFDHARLASALSLANDTSYVPDKLPFTTFEYVDDGRSLRLALDTARGFLCDLGAYRCVPETPERKPVTEVRSPDSAWIAFELPTHCHVPAGRARRAGPEPAGDGDGPPHPAQLQVRVAR